MTSLSLGTFENRATGKRYTVIKVQRTAPHEPVSGRAQQHDSGYGYETDTGLNLNDTSGNETVFELIEIDGTLHRVP